MSESVWERRLLRLHPDMELRGYSLPMMEQRVMEAKSLPLHEVYGLHPELFDALVKRPPLPEGFVAADGQFMLWALGLARFWSATGPDASQRVSAVAVMTLQVLIETGLSPAKVGFQRQMREHGVSYWNVAKGAQLDAAYKPDLDLLDFCEYARVSSPFTAERLMRADVPLEYAAAFPTV